MEEAFELPSNCAGVIYHSVFIVECGYESRALFVCGPSVESRRKESQSAKG